MKFKLFAYLTIAAFIPLAVQAAALSQVNIDVSKQNYSRQDLKASKITNANIVSSDFSGSSLQGSEFSNVMLSGGSMKGANLQNSTFVNTEFSGIDIRGADFSGASFTNCTFDQAIHDASTKFADVKLVNTDLPGHASVARSAATVSAISSNTVTSNTVTSSTGASNTTVVSTGGSDAPMNIVVGDAGGVNVELNNPGMHIKVGQSGSGNVTRVVTPGTNILVGSPAPREFKKARAIVEELQKPQSRVDLTVNFEFDSDKILAEGHKQVYEIAQALKSSELDGKAIRVEGHTDSKGTDEYNMDLSYRRAVSVMRELSEKYGVNTSKLTVKGFGESQPIATNDTDDGRALNRRVTLVNVSQDSSPRRAD